jgi:2'-5' RNA ligase
MPQRHDLYFFVRPPEHVAEAAALLWQRSRLRQQRGPGKPMPRERLHLTLQPLGSFSGSIPQSIIDLAMAAGNLLEHAPFDVRLNLLQSRGGTVAGAAGTVELSGLGRNVQSLRAFQRALGNAMRCAGFAQAQILRHFTPHMTLDYCTEAVPRSEVAPLAWTVNEFELVDSLHGKSQHEVLAGWPLVARQQSFSDW